MSIPGCDVIVYNAILNHFVKYWLRCDRVRCLHPLRCECYNLRFGYARCFTQKSWEEVKARLPPKEDEDD